MEINQYWPSATVALVCFVNCMTGLCHFYMKAWHTYAIHQWDICSVLFSQMFLEEVIPAFLSCHGPQNTQRCKSDADKQHACRGGEGGGFNVRGQRANHRRNEWEHLAFSGIFFLTFSGTNSRNFLEETKLLAVAKRSGWQTDAEKCCRTDNTLDTNN